MGKGINSGLRMKFYPFMFDPIGRVFEANGKIYRGIHKDKEEFVLSLFKSGLLPELIERGLFPETKISNKKFKTFDLVLEHEKITPIVYPFEWSFLMLKEAALMVIEMFEITNKYRMVSKDPHSQNITFKGCKPIFLDLGSFSKNSNRYLYYFFCHFLESFYYPLKLWSEGIISSIRFNFHYSTRYPTEEYLAYKYGCHIRHKPSKLLKHLKFRDMVNILMTSNSSFSNIINSAEKLHFYDKLKKLIRNLLIETGITLYIIDKLKEEINSLEVKVKTPWENYYGDSPKITPRFESIINYINELCKDAKTLISLGANQGFLENAILDRTHINRVICQDIDYKAIDNGFRKYKNRKDGKQITFTYYDLLIPILPLHLKPPHERFKSDIVLALALTHHLILGRGASSEYVIETISKYTRKYAFIEFMPRGLWTPESTVKVPDWYTKDNFFKAFNNYFEIILEKQLEENRILFIGKKRIRKNT